MANKITQEDADKALADSPVYPEVQWGFEDFVDRELANKVFNHIKSGPNPSMTEELFLSALHFYRRDSYRMLMRRDPFNYMGRPLTEWLCHRAILCFYKLGFEYLEDELGVEPPDFDQGPLDVGFLVYRRDEMAKRLASVCGNCRKDGHTLIQCAWPSIDGYVHGCPWCNTKEHELDQCPVQRQIQLEDKVQLVRERTNRPLLAGWPQPWDEIVTLFKSHGRPAPPSLPWGQDYPKELIMRDMRPWETVDYNSFDSMKTLPVDLRSATIETLARLAPMLNIRPLPVPNAPLVTTGMKFEELRQAIACHVSQP